MVEIRYAVDDLLGLLTKLGVSMADPRDTGPLDEVDQELEGDEHGSQENDIDTRPIPGFRRGQKHSGEHQKIEGHHDKNPDESEFLSDNGQDKIRMPGRKEAELTL